MGIAETLSTWLTNEVFGLKLTQPLGGSVNFFIKDVLQIFSLLVMMIYLTGLVRANLPTNKVSHFFIGRRRLLAYLCAAMIGATTPFCSCTSIPVFISFIVFGVPGGVAIAFLITSPMINEGVIALLSGSSGIGGELTAIYASFGIGAGIIGGIFFDGLGAEKYLLAKPLFRSTVHNYPHDKISWRARHRFAFDEGQKIMRKIWLWIVVEIAIGALLYGVIPDGTLAQYLNHRQWWSVPLAVMIGIPAYANATGIIPIVGALMQKGLPISMAFAFMLSTTGASLPGLIMLTKVMTGKLLAIFIAYILLFSTLCGWWLIYWY